MDSHAIILKAAHNGADILWCEMETRSGFTELLAAISPETKQKIIRDWSGIFAFAIREALKNLPTAEAGN